MYEKMGQQEDMVCTTDVKTKCQINSGNENQTNKLKTPKEMIKYNPIRISKVIFMKIKFALFY